ncbi:hypothetical protein [Nostoc sp.]
MLYKIPKNPDQQIAARTASSLPEAAPTSYRASKFPSQTPDN